MTDEIKTAAQRVEKWLHYQGAGSPHAMSLRHDDLRTLISAASARGVAEGWRPEVVAFANLMERQLRANDHKSGWKNDEPDDLMARVNEEVDELWQAIYGWLEHTGPTEPMHRGRVQREAADVANMVMMVADVCGALPAATSEVEAIARKLCEQHGGDPDAVASDPHDCWDGPLWTVFLSDADAILALFRTPPAPAGEDHIPDAGNMVEQASCHLPGVSEDVIRGVWRTMWDMARQYGFDNPPFGRVKGEADDSGRPI